ncbi:hypothetical protein GGR50DRAFT_686107 [Xylaria sp. CBS 124048]|nr:hypothetical protein GGR50DRAFT_686107 [Xylaria sp. CBS 124048]
MASQLPSFPRTVFTIVEPVSLIAGCLGPIINTDWFIASQTNNNNLLSSLSPSDDNARLVAQQLGNAYGLLFLVGVAVLYTTTEIKVVRNYLVALLIADITHVSLTIHALGYERTVDVAAWNPVTWGNIGFTVFLGLTRTAYLLGLFGSAEKGKMPAKKVL